MRLVCDFSLALLPVGEGIELSSLLARANEPVA